MAPSSLCPAKRPAPAANESKKAKYLKTAERHFKMADPEAMKVNALLYADLQQAMTVIMNHELMCDIFTSEPLSMEDGKMSPFNNTVFTKEVVELGRSYFCGANLLK